MSLKYIKVLSFCFVTCTTWGASVIHQQDFGSRGSFLSSTGGAIGSGGISIGYFTGAAMTDSAIQGLNPSTAFASLVANGFRDLRSVSGATAGGAAPGDFDWNFNNGAITGANLGDIGGTLDFTVGSAPNVPANTQLYIFAFDAGSFVGANPATSFASATYWAALKDTVSYLAPANDLNSRTLRIASADGVSEVLVGIEDGTGVRLTAVPEPSRVLLGIIGLGAFVVRRRR